MILNSTRHYEILSGKQSMLQTMFLGSSALLLAVSWFVTARWSSKRAFQNKVLDRSFFPGVGFLYLGNTLRGIMKI